ncbi:MAG: hypothetical protein HOY71_43935 [Nonomuraea sp.]|nr:hypothetical protein [Nonomuraea sp.]
MFKRRILVLGAAGFLALAGLGGSALAANAGDEPTVSPSDTVTCTTSDGKTLELQAGAPVMVDKDGNVKQGDPKDLPPLDTKITQAVPAQPLTPAATTEFGKTEPGDGPQQGFMVKTEDGKVTKTEGTLPAKELEGAKAFSVKCVKAK